MPCVNLLAHDIIFIIQLSKKILHKYMHKYLNLFVLIYLIRHCGLVLYILRYLLY